MGVLYCEATDDPIAEVMTGADLADPFAEDTTDVVDESGDDDAQLAAALADWRRLALAADVARVRATNCLAMAQAAKGRVRQIVRRDPARWIDNPPPGLGVGPTVWLTRDDA